MSTNNPTIYPALTQDRLKSLYRYDAETGVFTRLSCIGRHRRFKPGEVRTKPSALDGYHRLTVDRKPYLLHRLAWFYMHGIWPNEIDHINGKRTDNRAENLRLATRSENNQNRKKAQSNSRSGLLGACWSQAKGKWVAQIVISGRSKFIGHFDSKEEAHLAYLKAKLLLHPFQTLTPAPARR